MNNSFVMAFAGGTCAEDEYCANICVFTDKEKAESTQKMLKSLLRSGRLSQFFNEIELLNQRLGSSWKNTYGEHNRFREDYFNGNSSIDLIELPMI